MTTPPDRQALTALTELWQPKTLSAKRRFATLGAGMAGGLGPRLGEAGYRWMNMEPAPRGLLAQNAQRFNYDVFSCRTGAIGSAALLQQWVGFALNPDSVPDTIWDIDGRWHDPFRLGIEPDGFISRQEALSSRAITLTALEKTLTRTGMLVIVLDTVESWQDKTTGAEYAYCPEVFAKAFDPASHEIKSKPYPAVFKTLKDTLAMIQGANKSIRILLGVSAPDFTRASYTQDPAPLAASAGCAVLRSAVGQLAATQKGVAYLPVYEMGLGGANTDSIQRAFVQRLEQLAPVQPRDGSDPS